MKQAILSFLKTKMKGVQAAYLEGVAEKYSKTITDEEQIETILNDGVIDVLKFSAGFAQVEGDRRANEAQETAVSNYKKKHGIKDGGEGNDEPLKPKPKDGQDGGVPDWAQALIDGNKTLAEKLATLEAEKEQKNRMNAAVTALNASKKLPDKLKESWAGRINTDGDISEQIEALEAEYESIHATIAGGVAGKGLPMGQSVDGSVSDEEAKSIIEKM